MPALSPVEGLVASITPVRWPALSLLIYKVKAARYSKNHRIQLKDAL